MPSTHTEPSTRTEQGLDTTRQLLAELDALMDQMLAIPVTDQEDVSTSAGEQAPTLGATLTLLDAPSPEPSSPFATPPGHDQAADPVSATPFPDHAPSYTLPANEADSPPLPMLTTVAAPVDPVPLPSVPIVAWWSPHHVAYRLLVAVNAAYDHATTWLGTPGGVLRSRGVKAVLGVAGIGLTLLALGWLAKDALGWN